MGDKITRIEEYTRLVNDFLATRPDFDRALKRRIDDPSSWLVKQIEASFDDQTLGLLKGKDKDIVKIVMTIVESLLVGKVLR